MKTNKAPLISVVMPSYNAEAYIKPAILSIVNQTIPDWELIIVDDASQDNTLHVIKSFDDPRIFLIEQLSNQGYPFAMNVGISAASGKYIARMDADDVSAPSRLEEQLRALALYPEASFCGVARYRITPGGKMYADKKKPTNLYIHETWESLMQGNRIFTDPSVMIAKEKIMAVGGYRTFQRSGMDVDLWLRVMENFGPAITITKPLFGKGLEPGSLIYKPKTHLLNQIPRILALQRKESGTDEIQRHGNVNLDEYLKNGLLKKSSADDRLALLHGTLVTCIWLRDWKGVKIYWKKLNSILDPGFIVIIKNIFTVVRKLVSRLRNNPYVVQKY